MPSSDQDVESALNLAWSTIPAASAVPFLTIPALVELTPITEDKLKKYAARHVSGTSSEERQRRGVAVQWVDHKSKHHMPGHYVFVLFPPGSEEPQCDAAFRSRFYELKRLVGSLWCVDPHELSSKLLHRPLIKHSRPPTHGPSLACEFLGVAESASSKRPDREARAAVLCALGMAMSFGHDSLLMIPRSQPRRSLSPSSSSSFSSSSSSRGVAAPTAAPTGTTNAATMGVEEAAAAPTAAPTDTTNAETMDVEEAAVAGRGAAAARSFLLQLSDLRSDEKEEAFEVLREEIGVNARYKLRRVLEVAALGEMTPESVAERVDSECKALSKAMAANAATNGRDGATGAKRFVTSDAVLVGMDWDEDAALKREHAPVFMAVLAAALQTKSWYYENRHVPPPLPAHVHVRGVAAQAQGA